MVARRLQAIKETAETVQGLMVRLRAMNQGVKRVCELAQSDRKVQAAVEKVKGLMLGLLEVGNPSQEWRTTVGERLANMVEEAFDAEFRVSVCITV